MGIVFAVYIFLMAGEGRFKCAMEMELAWNIGSNITEI